MPPVVTGGHDLGENRFDRMKILVTMLDQNLADMDSGRLDEHKKARFKREPVIWALLLCRIYR